MESTTYYHLFLIRKAFGYKKLRPLKMVTAAAYKSGEIIIRVRPQLMRASHHHYSNYDFPYSQTTVLQ